MACNGFASSPCSTEPFDSAGNMPLDPSRIQGFGSDPVPADDSGTKFWSAIGAARDSMTSPAVRSAMDNVSLRVGDAWEAAAQDMSEMSVGVKTWVGSSMGRGDDEDDGGGGGAGGSGSLPAEPEVSPRHRKEAVELLSNFCENYPAVRVAPTSSELEGLWARCSILQASAVTAAICEQLSYGSGEHSWQPRLRVLYVLELLHGKEGLGQDVCSTVLSSAGGLLQHLALEVPQCKEKAQEVIAILQGRGPVREKSSEKEAERSGNEADQEGEQEGRPLAKKKAKPKEVPAPDLLDLVPGGSPTAAASAAEEICPGCSSVFAPGAVFCSNCGKKRPKAASAEAPAPARKKSGSSPAKTDKSSPAKGSNAGSTAGSPPSRQQEVDLLSGQEPSAAAPGDLGFFDTWAPLSSSSSPAPLSNVDLISGGSSSTAEPAFDPSAPGGGGNSGGALLGGLAFPSGFAPPSTPVSQHAALLASVHAVNASNSAGNLQGGAMPLGANFAALSAPTPAQRDTSGFFGTGHVTGYSALPAPIPSQPSPMANLSGYAALGGAAGAAAVVPKAAAVPAAAPTHQNGSFGAFASTPSSNGKALGGGGGYASGGGGVFGAAAVSPAMPPMGMGLQSGVSGNHSTMATMGGGAGRGAPKPQTIQKNDPFGGFSLTTPSSSAAPSWSDGVQAGAEIRRNSGGVIQIPSDFTTEKRTDPFASLVNLGDKK